MADVEILSPYAPLVAGGISTFSRNLKTAFERRPNLECSLASPPFGALSASRHPAIAIASWVALLVHLITQRPRAVFVQSHAALLIPAIVYARLFPETVVVFTFHTEWNSMSRPKARIVEWLLKQCTALTFVSSHLAERTMQLLRLPARRSHIVLPGVAVEASSPTEIARIASLIEGRRPVLCYVGAMTWKGKAEGLKILISALVEVRTHWPDILLLVAGTGALEHEIRRLSKDVGLERHVAFLGSVQSPEACLKYSDVYVHISLRESLGLAILEAMASGVPVIASDTGAAREIVSDGRTGLLVRPEVSEVSRAIRWLLSNPEIAQTIGEAGRDSVLRRFSWDQTAEEFLRLSRTLPGAGAP